MENRPLYAIANDIKNDWQKVSPYAMPYLQAMRTLDKIDDNYIHDNGRSIVLYFLSNANAWRGEKARTIKRELKQMAGIK